jgi:adenylyltransferase/sulfurtransferase
MTHAVSGDEPFADMTLAELGIPPLDIVTGRSGLSRVHFELSGDADAVLGELP